MVEMSVVLKEVVSSNRVFMHVFLAYNGVETSEAIESMIIV